MTTMLCPASLSLCIVIIALAVPGSLTWGIRHPSSDFELARIIGSGTNRGLKSRPREGPVTVQLHYYILGVMDLNEEEGYMESTGWLYMSWHDPRLVFRRGPDSSSDFAVDSDAIWTPDIELFNVASFGHKVIHSHKVQAWLRSNGSVILIEKAHIRSLCDVRGQLARGPAVTCSLKFGSWLYDTSRVDVVLSDDGGDPANRDGPKPLSYEEFQATGYWSVTNATQQRIVKTYALFPEQYSMVAFTFTFGR